MQSIQRAFDLIDSEYVASLVAPQLHAIVDDAVTKEARPIRTAKNLPLPVPLPPINIVYSAALRARTHRLLNAALDQVRLSACI
jgi:hypothetical protein